MMRMTATLMMMIIFNEIHDADKAENGGMYLQIKSGGSVASVQADKSTDRSDVLDKDS